MKRKRINFIHYVLSITILMIVCIWGVAAHAAASDFEKLEQAPMPAFSEPRVTTGVLKNGMRYYLLEDHQLPIINVNVITKVGSIYEPADKLGLANLLGILLRTGGTKQMTPEEIDRTFDDMAAEVGTGIGLEMGEGSFKCLSRDTQKTLSLFFDLLFSPRFDEKRIELGKINIIEALKREDDYPSQVVSREFKKLVYGEQSPWARRPNDKTVNGLSVDDLRTFHENYFVPANMIIAAAGDFQATSFLKLIEGLTKDIPNHKIEFPKVAPVELKFPNQEKSIEKPLTQSYIEIGHLGVKRHNPDKYALEIMDMILGAPIFKSRLMEDIRSNRGLAYSIASDFGWGTDYGLFGVYAATKVQSTAEVIKLVKEHLKRLAEKGDVTQAEMNFAKKSVLNRLIFEFDNSFKIVNQRARYRFYDYPDNYWHIYRAQIEKVTIDDVRRVAQKYLHPDGLSLVIVGPASSKISN